WDLYRTIDIVEDMKDGMTEGNIDDLAIGKDLFHLLLEVAPFKRAPEVVNHPEPATDEILSEGACVLIVEHHLPCFSGVDHWVAEQIRVMYRYDASLWRDIYRSDSPKNADEILIPRRIIRVPVFQVMRNASVVHEADEGEVVFLHLLGRKSSKIAV